MVELAFRVVLQSGQEWLDMGIRDIAVREGAAGPLLYVQSGPAGGLASWQLQEGQSAFLSESRAFSPLEATWVGQALFVLEGGISFGGQGDVGLLGYQVDAAGDLGGGTVWEGLSGRGGVTAVAQAAGDLVFVSTGAAAGVRCYRDMGNGQLQFLRATQSQSDAYLGTVGDLDIVTIADRQYLLTMDTAGRGVSSFLIDPDTGALAARGQMGAAEGVGVMAPVALETVAIGSEHYAILASAGSESGALSVLRIRDSGQLQVTDHVLDTRATRFGQVQDVVVIESSDRAYLVAGGGDAGLSLFLLMETGRLVHLQALADGEVPGLGGPVALAAARTGDEVQLFSAGEGEVGVVQLGFSMVSEGISLMGGGADDQLSGGGADDILNGSGGDDLIIGGAGDDILVDGAGADTMEGSEGADIFVLDMDGATDLIVGFEPGQDRLDLSGFAMLYDPGQLTYVPRAGGAALIWRDEVTEVQSLSGSTLGLHDIFGHGFTGPDRPPLMVGATISGGAASDMLEGYRGDDLLQGGTDNDTLFGYEGWDTLLGGEGDDSLHGGPGHDSLYGGLGRDRVRMGVGDDVYFDENQSGVSGSDTILADAGNDTVFGLGGNDLIQGHAGYDSLMGGAGQDSVFGGDGFDTIRAGDGADLTAGGNGRDLVFLGRGDDVFHDNAQGGSVGRDTIYAGEGRDTIEGGNGDDVIHGQTGSDRLIGRKGNDRIFGGDQDDFLSGGQGADMIAGGRGRDTAYLGEGDDTYVDTDQSDANGRDRVFGGFGNDTINAGGGDDTLHGGAGADVFVFTVSPGDRVITDFTPGEDRLHFGIGESPIWDDSLQGALLEWSGGSLLLADVPLALFDQGDILFM